MLNTKDDCTVEAACSVGASNRFVETEFRSRVVTIVTLPNIYMLIFSFVL